jgi:hypothetical protein
MNTSHYHRQRGNPSAGISAMTTQEQPRATVTAAGVGTGAAAMLPYIRFTCGARQEFNDDSVVGLDGRHVVSDAARAGTDENHELPVDALIDAVSRLFDTYVLGHDRPGKVKLLLDLVMRSGATIHASDTVDAGDGAIDGPRVGLDLAALPMPRLRYILDAFAAEIDYDCRQHRIRIAIRVSASLQPFGSTAGLGLRVLDGWPSIDSSAAQALLRLLTNVAQAGEVHGHAGDAA